MTLDLIRFFLLKHVTQKVYDDRISADSISNISQLQSSMELWQSLAHFSILEIERLLEKFSIWLIGKFQKEI